MRPIPWILSAALAMASAEAPTSAEPASAAPRGALGLADFLRIVAEGNLEAAAQRLSVPLSEAQIEVARAFPDPAVSGGLYGADVSGQGQPTAVGVALTVPLELGGKRGARVRAAEADVAVARVQLQEVLRTLRASAAGAYIDAARARLVVQRKRKTLESLEGLVRINEQRLRAGDIGELLLVQSRVEARNYRSEVLAAEAEVAAADLNLRLLAGAARGRLPAELQLASDLSAPARRFELGALLRAAERGRLDLRAQRLGVSAGAARVRLAQANRWVDLNASVGWTRNLATTAEAFAQPTNDVLSATLGLPLPLSRIYQGELRGARVAAQQAEAQVRALELRVETEVRQALAQYEAAAARVSLYTGGTLADAERVLQGTLYNYQRGGASLLEVLNAQRTVDDVYLSYYAALAEHARGLVQVERAAGLWDVSL